LVLLRRRPDRGPDRSDGDARRRHRSREPRQPGRISDPRARAAGDRDDWVALDAREEAAALRRSPAAQARHLEGARSSGLAADDRNPRRARAHDSLFRNAAAELPRRSVRWLTALPAKPMATGLSLRALHATAFVHGSRQPVCEQAYDDDILA